MSRDEKQQKKRRNPYWGEGERSPQLQQHHHHHCWRHRHCGLYIYSTTALSSSRLVCFFFFFQFRECVRPCSIYIYIPATNGGRKATLAVIDITTVSTEEVATASGAATKTCSHIFLLVWRLLYALSAYRPSLPPSLSHSCRLPFPWARTASKENCRKALRSLIRRKKVESKEAAPLGSTRGKEEPCC